MDPLMLLIVVCVIIIAAAIFFRSTKKETVSTDIVYSDALNSILKGDNAEAIKLLKQVVNRDSDNIGAYLQLGNLVRSSNPAQAAKIHQSLTVRPKLAKHTSKEIHQALALDYMEVDNLKRAKIEAEMVLKYEKNDLWAHQFLLRIAEKERNWEEARGLAEKIQKLSGSKDPRLLSKIQLQAGQDCVTAGDSKKALQHLEKAVKLDPSFHEPYLDLANLFEQEKNTKKALINWENYLINSENVDSAIYKKIESALFEANRFSEAEQLYNRILDKKPNDKFAMVKLINLLVERGEIDEAVKFLENSIKDNNSKTAKLLKIKLLIDKANPIDLKNQIDDIIDN